MILFYWRSIGLIHVINGKWFRTKFVGYSEVLEVVNSNMIIDLKGKGQLLIRSS